jgi:hypothetical protein
MSTTAPAPVQNASANQYELQDHSGKLKVTYYPFAPGPMVQGQTPGPELAYSGPQGDFTFRGAQVEMQDSTLGQMISVVLKPQNDTGSLTFVLFLPQVVLGSGSNSDAFETICVTARKPGFTQKPGSQIHYEVERMRGTARIGPLPL